MSQFTSTHPLRGLDGVLLAKRIETQTEEQNHSLKLAEERAEKKGAETLKRWNIAKTFFEAARVTLTQQILDRVPTAHLGVLVGQTSTKQENMDVYHLFSWYGKAAEIRATHEAYPLWKEFYEWAQSQKLMPEWAYEHDGVGVHSWYVLKLKPVRVTYPRR